MKNNKKDLSAEHCDQLFGILKTRFEKNAKRHEGLEWVKVQEKIAANPDKLWSLDKMEETGGEPDVIGFDEKTGEYIFCDCSTESPGERRSFCYDLVALESRKANKPAASVVEMAEEMGIELLSEEQYHQLQQIGNFDLKTSSWLKTPPEIRKLGGAIFGDRRFERVFIYHNGADSYYAARGFRGLLRI
ncbi:DUF4256 domain-containing protein [Dyadobacter sp. CY345]|uniref:DUF4256 domain-containing protein n=1 Tax=Dyadobacter sp. CY345 TaxID=2909335 RepID=UPI001F297C09|nr:DUF4256 domain-containing protein [Dyadobacter sp. CY345]MCF2443558.1 DUF4256 domain-containing protein [Dyadobacter sp. CY345]